MSNQITHTEDCGTTIELVYIEHDQFQLYLDDGRFFCLGFTLEEGDVCICSCRHDLGLALEDLKTITDCEMEDFYLDNDKCIDFIRERLETYKQTLHE